MIQDQAFDAVVTDFHMPGQNGLWLWQHAVRTRPELRSRFLLLGSEPLPPGRAREYFTQFERLLAKPFLLDALCHEVDAIVRRGPHAQSHRPYPDAPAASRSGSSAPGRSLRPEAAADALAALPRRARAR